MAKHKKIKSISDLIKRRGPEPIPREQPNYGRATGWNPHEGFEPFKFSAPMNEGSEETVFQYYFKEFRRQGMSGVEAARKADALVKGYNSSAQPKPQRTETIHNLTTPNMIGFFPAYDKNARHALRPVTQFDTETADDNRQIIEIAGFQTILNLDTLQFEQLNGATPASSQFYRTFNPRDARYVQTEQVHGRSKYDIMKLDDKIPGAWSTNDLKDFLAFAKDTNLTGHNIMTADLSWIHGYPSEGFKQLEPRFKQGILDSLHLAQAIFGRGKEGSLSLQTLASKLGVLDELKNKLPAHAGWADSIVNVKVTEKLLQKYKEHPVVQEWLEALSSGVMHSHYLETPDELHGSYYGTHTISGKPKNESTIAQALATAARKVKIKVKETYLPDLAAITGEDPEDIAEGHVDWESHMEEQLGREPTVADVELIKPLADEIKRLKEATRGLTTIDGIRSGSSAIPRTVNAIKNALRAEGYNGRGWDNPDAMFRPAILDEDNNIVVPDNGVLASPAIQRRVAEAFRTNNLGDPGEDWHWDRSSAGYRYTQMAMAGLEQEWLVNQQKLAQSRENILNKNFAAYGKSPAYQDLESKDVNELTRADITKFSQFVKNEERRKKEQAKQKAEEDKRLAEQQAKDEAFIQGAAQARWQKDADFVTRARAAKEAEAKQRYTDENAQIANEVNKELKTRAEQQAKDEAFIQGAAQARWQKDADFVTRARAAKEAAAKQRYADENAQIANEVNKELKTRAEREKQILALQKQQHLAYEQEQKDRKQYIDQLNKQRDAEKAAAQAVRSRYAMRAYYSSGGFADITQIQRARMQGWNDVGDAWVGLLPQPFRYGGHRFVQAGQQFMNIDLSRLSNLQNTWGRVGGMAMSLGVMSGNPLVAAAGAAINLGSHFYVSNKSADITQATSKFAGQINLLNAGIQMILAPLKMLRGGFRTTLALWGKLNKIWSSQYGTPLTYLTGVTVPHYSAMLMSDRALNLQAGSINASHEALAYGQAGLYSSGQFDEKRLVAAARLGVFSQVYAPMGGNTEEQQRSYINKLSRDLKGASTQKRQEIMYLASQIDSTLPQTLQRMELLGINDYGALQNGSYIRGLGVRYGRHMSKADNRMWAETATAFGAQMQFADYGIKRLATPLWNSFGNPIMNQVNKFLDELPGVFENGFNIDKFKIVADNFWEGMKDIFGIKGKSLDDIKQSAITMLKNFLGSAIGQGIQQGVLNAIEWIAKQEMLLVNALSPMLQKLSDYIQDIDFNVTYSRDEGFKVHFKSPEQVRAERRERINSSISESLSDWAKGESLAEQFPGFVSAWNNINPAKMHKALVDLGIPEDILGEGFDKSKLTGIGPAQALAGLQALQEYDKSSTSAEKAIRNRNTLDPAVASIINAFIEAGLLKNIQVSDTTKAFVNSATGVIGMGEKVLVTGGEAVMTYVFKNEDGSPAKPLQSATKQAINNYLTIVQNGDGSSSAILRPGYAIVKTGE